ncbi:MAG: hypothetical protein MN733_37755, partial [Nitrososphaera sp.]|nr:hypothetical protein [Nitrososphaera sp.]
MVVGSGTAPYAYVGPALNFSALNQRIAPSAVLYEEAMFVLKAEYNRVRMETSGFEASPREFGQAYDPAFPSFNAKFVNNSGTFIKYVNRGVSGLFDPDPSGRFLDGRFNPVSGTPGSSGVPGMFYSRDYILDMREVMVNVMQAISQRIDDSSFFICASSVFSDWLTKYKGYNDGMANSGFFYEQSGTLDFTDDDYLNDWLFAVKSSGVGTSGLRDRHLNEVRYQPMPYLWGTSGSVQGVVAPSGEPSTTFPISPLY